MSKATISQLDKVLALADSSYEGEAIVAVRKARAMLSRDGLSFSDLARAAQKPRINLPFGLLSGQHIVSLETEILQLRQDVEQLRDANIAHEMQADLWKRRIADLEHKLAASNTEAERWRQLARETVDKLWDLGQSIQQDEPEQVAETTAKTA